MRVRATHTHTHLPLLWDLSAENEINFPLETSCFTLLGFLSFTAGGLPELLQPPW